jgi:cytochrome c-type biogenesis protein CcsB
MAIWSSIFGIAVIGTVSKFSVFTEAVYRAGLFLSNPSSNRPFPTVFRLEMPYVGPLLVLTAFLLLGVIVAFTSYIYQQNESAKRFGHILLKVALVAQLFSVVLLVYGIKNTSDVYPRLQAEMAAKPSLLATAGKAMAEKQDLTVEQRQALTPAMYQQTAKSFMQSNGEGMFLSLQANPVELSALITALVATLFVLGFSFRTERLRERLPSVESLDNLMYKTACLAFAGLAMLLITGAIWANESWGRPWGFDSKETGALVAWLTYAAFIHTRISRGWKGRSSAYFAVIGFLLVIFTYLGVSYLLPGLHSYA